MKNGISICPVELRSLLEAELVSSDLRYMLAMYWQGRSDKIPERLFPLLEWLTKNGLPSDVAATWAKFQPGRVAFVGRDHHLLLDIAMLFAAASLAQCA